MGRRGYGRGIDSVVRVGVAGRTVTGGSKRKDRTSGDLSKSFIEINGYTDKGPGVTSCSRYSGPLNKRNKTTTSIRGREY